MKRLLKSLLLKILLCAWFVIVLVACSGGLSAPSSRNDFVGSANATCGKYNKLEDKELHRAVARAAKARIRADILKAYAEVLPRVASLIRRQARELGALEPPANAAKRWHGFVNQLRTLAGQIDVAADKARSYNWPGFNRALTEPRPIASTVKFLRTQGLSKCAGGSGHSGGEWYLYRRVYNRAINALRRMDKSGEAEIA